jgi:hypothetical protein
MIVFWTNAGMVFIGSCNAETSQDSSHNRHWQGSLGKGRTITGNFEEILRRQAKICDGQIAIVARDTPRKVLVYRSWADGLFAVPDNNPTWDVSTKLEPVIGT